MLNKSSRVVLLFLIIVIIFFFFVNPSVKVSVKTALDKINDYSTYRCRLEESAQIIRDGKSVDSVSVWETAVIQKPYQSMTSEYTSEENRPLTKVTTKYEQTNGQNIDYHLLSESTGIWFSGTQKEQEEPWYLKEMVLLTEKEAGEEKAAGTTMKVYDIAVDGGMFARMYMTEEEQTAVNLQAFKQVFGDVKGKAYIKKSSGLVLISLNLTPNVLAMEKWIKDGKWLQGYDTETHSKLEATIEMLDINENVQIALPKEAL